MATTAPLVIEYAKRSASAAEPAMEAMLRITPPPLPFMCPMHVCMQTCIGHMKGSGGGVILNMASIAGSAALADRFAYSMTKGAVVAMTYSVAKDYVQHNIRCNCISPARVHTPFVDDYLRRNYPGKEQEMYEKLAKSQPIGRMGEPQEVASLTLFLCSDEAAFITGADYPLDGGFFNLRG